MPEQPHEYLANTRDRNCKLCLRDKDHSIHKEAQEMPLPGTIKEDMLEIQNRLDQCDRLQAINADLLEALEAMTDRFEETLAATHATRTDRAEIKEARKLVAKAKAGKE